MSDAPITPEESDGSIKVAGTYIVAQPTTESTGVAFLLYADQSVKWITVAQLEDEPDQEAEEDQ